MDRMFKTFLDGWLGGPSRMPLVIRGARQVGKTWLVRDLAKRKGLVLVEVNFERDSRSAQFFDHADPKRVFDDITLSLDINAEPDQAVLFLDEIQAAPEVLAKLRWFAEEMPELPVIAAGSLLEFSLAEFSSSMPVGRIRYAHVEPLSFCEYLIAHDRTKLLARLREWSPPDSLSLAVHEQAEAWFDRYAMVGGMPGIVSKELSGVSPGECRSLQRDLVQTYRDDFAKYSGRLEHQLLDPILLQVVRSLGSKFVYSQVGGGIKHYKVKKALELLAMARVCHLIPHSDANGFPLAAQVNDGMRKVSLLDVGFAHGLWNTPAGQAFPGVGELAPQIRSGMAEQLAAQQLRLAVGDPTLMGQLYYWQRGGGRSGEIDYLLELNGRVIPVEVKSGTAGSMKSLHHFMFDKQLDIAVRIDRNPPTRQTVEVRTTHGDPVAYELLNIPHYLTWRLPELLGQRF